jgi:hypothetical protein
MSIDPTIHKITTDLAYLQLFNDTDIMTARFRLSDTETYEIRCPKENMMRFSQFAEKAGLFGASCVEFDLRNEQFKNNETYFKIISDYICSGKSAELNKYKAENILGTGYDSSDEEEDVDSTAKDALIGDLFSFYHLSKQLGLEDLQAFFENQAVQIVRVLSYDYEHMRKFLMLGIQLRMHKMISLCFPRILGAYWAALETNNSQHAFSMKQLVSKSLEHLKDTFTHVKIRGNCLAPIATFNLEESEHPTFTYTGPQRTIYRLPKEIIQLFPNMQKVSWHVQVGPFQFDRYYKLTKDTYQDAAVLVRESEGLLQDGMQDNATRF